MKRNREDAPPLSVVLVCCGEPKKSMGWFHLTQLLEHQRVRVSAVVEPWFLGKGANGPGAEQFAAFRAQHPDLCFFPSLSDVPAKADAAAPLLVLIAGRTCDAAKLFEEAVSKGATHVYLEKPGGVSAAQLDAMRALAAKSHVEVIIGYNKNVSAYARDAMAFLRKTAKPWPAVTLEHCNDFAPGDGLVDFLRGPGGEGMLHNMCCHE